MKFKEKLQELFEEYLATLDDTDKDEYYTTELGIADGVFKDFMEWFEKRNA